MANKPELNVYVVREYEKNGEKRKFFTKVGVGFLTEKQGAWLRLDDGIAISGRNIFVGHAKEAEAAGETEGQ